MATPKFNRVQAYLNNFFWLFLTYLLAPYFYFRIFLRARRRKNIPLKVLVIQTAKIGDLVCTTPVFREIKKNFPSCYLSTIIISKTKDILKNNPRLDEIILINDYPGISGKIRLLRKLRKAKYDWVINLFPGSFDNIIAFWSWVPGRVTTTHKYCGEITKLLSVFNNHRLEYRRRTSLIKHFLTLLKFMGIKEFSEKKEIFVRPEEERKALDFLKTQNLNSNDLLIGISVAAGNKLKQWEPAKFAQLADQLAEKLKATVIFIGSVDDNNSVENVQKMMRNNSINACGVFKLYELAALLKQLKLFISADSGPLHMADAMDVPLVLIAGPIDIHGQNPLHERCKIVQKNIPCVPCLFTISAVRFCQEGHLRCLKEITPEDVFEAAQSLLNSI